MALHKDLPIYKAAYDLLGVAVEITKNFPRDFKRLMGDKIREECVEIITGKRTGMHTNGGCHCIQNLKRGHMSILASRLMVIADKKVNLDSV